jgi:hypothetical protein
MEFQLLMKKNLETTKNIINYNIIYNILNFIIFYSYKVSVLLYINYLIILYFDLIEFLRSIKIP